MIVSLHVFIALASIVYTTYLFMQPTRLKFRVHFGLIALTVASGTYLLANAHGHMFEVCTMGLGYLIAVTAGTLAARAKFARQPVRIYYSR